jgi:Heterokaryon incompatibility protein (HET)
MDIFDLEGAPDYDAISYTWGGERFDRYVIVDGQRLAITRNAKCILEQRASSFRVTWLWIDAICIDQLNASEKRFQVAMMGQIYAQAQRTLIWMNNDGVKPSQAIRVLVIFSIMRILKKDFAENEKFINDFCFHLLDPFWWNYLQTFLTNSYWTRVWIIQEISRGKRVHLLYGGFILDWQYVMASLQLMMYSPFYGHSRKIA